MGRHIFAPLLIAAAVFLVLPAESSAQWCGVPASPGCFWYHGDASLKVGYFGYRNGADISFTTPNQQAGSLMGLRQQFDLQGIALDLMARLGGASPFGLALGGGYSIYFQQPAVETEQFVGSPSRVRRWSTTPQSGTVSLALTVDAYPGLTGIVGARYENFMANFVNPNSGFGSTYGQYDTATVTVNAWTPYLGLVWSNAQRGAGIDLRAGVLGTPLVLGSIDYVETVASGLIISGTTVHGFPASNNIHQGYLVEGFGDASVGTIYGMQLGAYAKYHVLRATTSIRVGERDANIPNVSYDVNFQKQNWGVGGRLSIFF
jgi:hypothetical protein